MRYVTLPLDLAQRVSRALDEFVELAGPCDHDTGICICSYRRAARELADAIGGSERLYHQLTATGRITLSPAGPLLGGAPRTADDVP